MSYLPRSLDKQLDRLMPEAPAIALDGSKGVGKTVTASRRAEHTWNLERPDAAPLVLGDDFASVPDGTIFIDEWQRAPDSWNAVRRAVDAGAHPGRFLLAGSATPQPGTSTHSGAARILSFRMRPMGLHERGITEPSISFRKILDGSAPPITGKTDFTLSHYFDAITASGFPSIFNKSPNARQRYLDSYIQRIIDRDLPGQGYTVRSPETLMRWLRAYAAASSTTASHNKILDIVAEDGQRPAKTTAITYRDYLSQLWLLDPLDGWAAAPNPFVQVRQTQSAQKHQLADPALAARLLNLTARKLATPSGSHMAGPLFESLVALTIRVIAEAEGARVSHFRTSDSYREIDLIVEGEEGQLVAVEVKLSADYRDSDLKHLKWFRDQLKDDVVDTIVVTSGEWAYRRHDGIAVIPLALLGH